MTDYSSLSAPGIGVVAGDADGDLMVFPSGLPLITSLDAVIAHLAPAMRAKGYRLNLLMGAGDVWLAAWDHPATHKRPSGASDSNPARACCLAALMAVGEEGKP